ncbi:MAG: sulfatase [Mangrovibacterium sp.]
MSANDREQSPDKTQNSFPEKPNFIFYLADDQDILDYGCYGNELVNMPTVDRLASQGMRFTHAFTGQAICAPSRSQLYTGMYPMKNGCYANHISARPGIKSIAQYLKQAGYDVILAGKSHVKPNSVFDWTYSWIDEKEKKNGEPHPRIPIEHFKEYVKNTDNPFCIFFTSHYPHSPFAKGDRYNENDIKIWPYFEKTGKDLNAKVGYYRNIDIENEELEDLLDYVDSEKELENSVFIYSSDHGTSGKYTTYNCGLNVPFIVRWKGVVKEGSSTSAMVHFTDVLPTFLEIAGVPAPNDIDGKSFLKVLQGETNNHHELVYGVDIHQNLLNCYIFPSRMAMNTKYKYIRNYNSVEVYKENFGNDENINKFIERGAKAFPDIPYEELYDLENDPYELKNLANDTAYSIVKEEMIASLNAWMYDQDDFLLTYKMPLLKAPDNPLDKKSKHNMIPPELEGILSGSEYMPSHY